MNAGEVSIEPVLQLCIVSQVTALEQIRPEARPSFGRCGTVFQRRDERIEYTAPSFELAGQPLPYDIGQIDA
jgi:hypothetical protein